MGGWPQIVSVLTSKSAAGLSRASLEAETVGYFVSLAYRCGTGLVVCTVSGTSDCDCTQA
jgi:hypothetical protein